MRINYRHLSHAVDAIVHALLNCILTCKDKMLFFSIFCWRRESHSAPHFQVPAPTALPLRLWHHYQAVQRAWLQTSTFTQHIFGGERWQVLTYIMSWHQKVGWRGCPRLTHVVSKCSAAGEPVCFLYGLRSPKPDNRWDHNYKQLYHHN